jgi:hypothetical protein
MFNGGYSNYSLFWLAISKWRFQNVIIKNGYGPLLAFPVGAYMGMYVLCLRNAGTSMLK